MGFKITKESKAKSLRLIYFGIVLYIGVVVWASFYPFRWYLIIGIAVYMVLIGYGPGLYLYKEYMGYNENCLLDIKDNSLSFQNGSWQSIAVPTNEIERINVYIPPNNYRNRGAFTLMEVFSYARFELKDGREFYVTCLMIPDLKLRNFINESFSEVPVNFHPWWIFPSIRLCNYFRRNNKSVTIQ